jgi:hypothetical protein
MDSVVHSLATELQGKALVAKVYPQDRKLFRAFEVRGIPAFFVVRNAEIRWAAKGIISKATLRQALMDNAL